MWSPFLESFQLLLGLGTPNSPFVLLDPQNGPCFTPKALPVKGKEPISTENALKQGKQKPKGQMVPFSRVYRHPVHDAKFPKKNTILVIAFNKVPKWPKSPEKVNIL